MHCPTLSELPPPPPGKTGWPWTEESPQLPETMPDGSPWPQVSIVTPSYNQAQFIEETIRSVLLQGYPDLEYIIIDGGSTDGSVDLIRKYEPWLAYWASEPDEGQSHALNKGFTQVTGDILGWLNSDDLYCPGALRKAVRLFQEETDVSVVYGGHYRIDAEGQIIDKVWASPFDLRYMLYNGMDISQQALFWRSDLMRRVGMIDEELVFCMDRDLILRLIWHGKVIRTTKYLGMFRLHSEAKTATIQDVHRREIEIVQLRYRHYHDTVLPAWFWRVYLSVKRLVLIVKEAGLSYTIFKMRTKLGRRLGVGAFAKHK